MTRFADWTEILSRRELARLDAHRAWECDHLDYVRTPVTLNYKHVYPFVVMYSDGTLTLCFTNTSENTGFWEVEVQHPDEAEELLNSKFLPQVELTQIGETPFRGYH